MFAPAFFPPKEFLGPNQTQRVLGANFGAKNFGRTPDSFVTKAPANPTFLLGPKPINFSKGSQAKGEIPLPKGVPHPGTPPPKVYPREVNPWKPKVPNSGV